jgi:hypothetical protein
MAIDLNRWHHAVHQVSGSMALRFNKATPEDLRQWAAALRLVADEMETAADWCENELEDEIAFR